MFSEHSRHLVASSDTNFAYQRARGRKYRHPGLLTVLNPRFGHTETALGGFKSLFLAAVDKPLAQPYLCET